MDSPKSGASLSSLVGSADGLHVDDISGGSCVAHMLLSQSDVTILPMKTTLAAVACVCALALPVSNAVALTRATGKTTTRKTVSTRKVTGASAQADQWGTVQINVTARITVSGGKKTIRYTDLGGSYSYHTSRSQYIMSQALPMLRQEFLSAQSPNVQMISGATYTSQAFEQSLQSALLKLR